MQREDLALDFYERLRGRLRRWRIGAALADLLARELSLLACASFVWWRAPAARAPAVHTFTIHRRSQYAVFLAVIMFVAAVETAGVHVLLRHASPRLAYALLGLSMYGMVWLFGDFRALKLRPVLVQDGVLHVRVGLRRQLRIALQAVECIEAVPSTGEPDRQAADYARCTAFGAPELLLRLRTPAELQQMVGPTRVVTCIGLKLDDEVSFRRVLSAT
jgi:hypothetical protein